MATGMFDLIVIGSGSGLEVSAVAAYKGWKVAIVEEGPFGGTCLNRGCIPSKMLIHHADVTETILNSKKFFIDSQIKKIDFAKITKWAYDEVTKDANSIELGNKQLKNVKVFKARGNFVGPMTIKVGNKTIRGKKILIAAGARPSIPPISGINKVPYITSDEALFLKKLPKSMIIVGGGYIAAELAHFFSMMGTKITIVQRNILLVPDEDKEIAEAYTKIAKEKYDVLLGYAAKSVFYRKGKFTVIAEPRQGNSSVKLDAEQLLIATGRIPNTDILDVEKTNVEVNEHGFVKVNDYMETSARNIWALGDICGIYMFKHSANWEADYIIRNIFGKKKSKVDYKAMPHAVFSSPQIAGVGLTEQQLEEKDTRYVKGTYKYKDTGMGWAMKDETGFVKVLADPKTRNILGCHIMGPHASAIIHEAIVAMKFANVRAITDSVHIHPALSEVMQRAFLSIDWKKVY